MKTKTKKRKKQLATIRARKDARLGLQTDNPDTRLRIARAVHGAVCRFTEGDGFGKCALYAVAGAGLVHKVFKLKTVVLAGTMHIVIDRHDDYVDTMTFLGSNWRNGEVHVWFAIPHEGGLVELVDLSSRHYRRYVEEMQMPKRYEWPYDVPPEYLWCSNAKPGDWVALQAMQEPTAHMWAALESDPCAQTLIQMAIEEFDSLGHCQPECSEN
jgi:hypothetical protein